MFSKRVYLDYASTTPVDKKVLAKMNKYFAKDFYNSQSLYQSALLVKKDLEEARKKIARICGVRTNEIIFTASGTESNNLAILGIIKAFRKKYSNVKPKIISTVLEHSSILEPLKSLESDDLEIVYLKVNTKGQINLGDLQKQLNQNVALITFMYANNEIGTILPIRKISGLIRKFKNENQKLEYDFPFLHTDASQAPNYLDININSLGVDLMTLDGSKIYGPKGIGVLVKKNHVQIEKIFYGGNQEFGFRPGTENVPLIIGMANALELTVKNRVKESDRIIKLRNYLIDGFLKNIPNSKLNGDLENRLPNNANFCVKNLFAEFAVIKLGLYGVECSATTTCKNISEETRSYVVDQLGDNCGASSLRFTLGKFTKKADIDFALKQIKKILPPMIK
jgi:cysteine desulfurase